MRNSRLCHDDGDDDDDDDDDDADAAALRACIAFEQLTSVSVHVCTASCARYLNACTSRQRYNLDRHSSVRSSTGCHVEKSDER